MIPQSQARKEKRNIIFVTGNENKIRELQNTIDLNNVEITARKIDLMEVQDKDPLRITQRKCEEAYRILNKNGEKNCVLIEDVSLTYKALNGLPGSYIKCKFCVVKYLQQFRSLTDDPC